MPVRGASVLTGLVAGSFIAHGLFALVWPTWPVITILTAVLALSGSWRARACVLSVLISLTCTMLALHDALADRLEPQRAGETITVTGRIAGLPESFDSYTRFRFRPERSGQDTDLPGTVLAYWYRDAPKLAAGETWRLELQLKPPWGRVNFSGDDRERWLFAQGIGALATVRGGTRTQPARSGTDWFDSQRARIKQALLQVDADRRSRSILIALAIADRSLLSNEDRQSLAATGTAHLLAISGLHVGLAAIGGFWLCRALMFLLPLPWVQNRAHRLALVSGLLAAVLYSGLAGFGISTLRALVMLLTGVAALSLARTVHPLQAFMLALAGLLLFDPLAPLSAGFWLSFGAVGILLMLFAFRRPAQHGFWRSLFAAQVGISLCLLPLSAYWFQATSLSGLVANLIAIPWVSFTLVPPLLAGLVLLPLSASASGLMFTLAAASTQMLMQLLEYLAQLPGSSLSIPQPGIMATALALFGGLLLLLPRGVGHRWLGLILLLPLVLPASPPADDTSEVLVLDVGQGTAVLISSAKHLAVYDSGPGNGDDYDLVDSVVVPAIRNMGYRTPDHIVISHGDLDHAGGLLRLRALYPDVPMHAGLRHLPPGVAGCDETLFWQWGEVAFQALHPSPFLPYLGNDSSCVIVMRAPGLRLLLAGDISAAIEHRLIARIAPRQDILLVAHHGSNTSSSRAFLEHTQARIAIATVGLGNRFGFPRPEVEQRFAAIGTPLWTTGACGALRIRVAADGTITSASARRQRPAPWRWRAASGCP